MVCTVYGNHEEGLFDPDPRGNPGTFCTFPAEIRVYELHSEHVDSEGGGRDDTYRRAEGDTYRSTEEDEGGIYQGKTCRKSGIY